jgi:predicted O-linked N-acetylglucosamine transferase (SPINDLY family)
MWRAIMPEVASEISEALREVSESFLTLAAIGAYLAASNDDSMTQGEIRQAAANMFHTARLRFGGVKYDGQRIEDMNIEELDAMWCKFWHIDPKKLPKR